MRRLAIILAPIATVVLACGAAVGTLTPSSRFSECRVFEDDGESSFAQLYSYAFGYRGERGVLPCFAIVYPQYPFPLNPEASQDLNAFEFSFAYKNSGFLSVVVVDEAEASQVLGHKPSFASPYSRWHVEFGGESGDPYAAALRDRLYRLSE